MLKSVTKIHVHMARFGNLHSLPAAVPHLDLLVPIPSMGRFLHEPDERSRIYTCTLTRLMTCPIRQIRIRMYLLVGHGVHVCTCNTR